MRTANGACGAVCGIATAIIVVPGDVLLPTGYYARRQADTDGRGRWAGMYLRIVATEAGCQS